MKIDRIRRPNSLIPWLACVLAGCASTGTPPGAPPGVSPAGAGAATAATTAAPSAAARAPTAPRPPGTSGPAGAGAPSAAPAPGAAVARPPAPAPGTPAPFADVTRDAKRTEGFIGVWTRDEKTWLEIPAERLEQPMFLGASLASGLAQPYVLPGLMAGEQVVALRRVGNTVQLVARNLRARAEAGTPLARALAESYSESLLGAAPLAAAPHPDRKSLLVEAQALLGGDIVGLQGYLESMFRLAYAPDRANSSIERFRSGTDLLAITLRNHYAVPRLPPPPVQMPGGPPPNPAALPNPPRAVPDPRSFFISVAYSLTPLPAAPMRPRRADPRVGYFTDAHVDFANEFDDHRVHLVTRWRLEKKEPAAAVSEPRQPIRVVMDRNIPQKWRTTVREGILEWNKAFERAGFRDALVVEQQPEDADWTAFEGVRLLAVRWFAMEGPGALAVGPSQSDPRSGEILRGAAIIPENWVRLDRVRLYETQPRLADMQETADASAPPPWFEFARRHAQCSYATDALEHAAFGLELLQLRGDIAPDSPAAAAYVAASLKAVVIHEVGHALGLMHNFKASAGVTQAQLRDKAFTSTRGTSNSVMDYNPPNIALHTEPLSDHHMTVLGAYDYWAIEWGYREFAPAEEAQALAKLAARSDAEPALAFATDVDLAQADPSVGMFDQGDDALAFARRELELARELWVRTQARQLAPQESYEVYRSNLARGLLRFAGIVPILAKHVGGAHWTRNLAGSGQPVVTLVSPNRQREALSLLLTDVFAGTSFRFPPQHLARLGVDQLERTSRFTGSNEFDLAGRVLAIQRSALDALTSDAVAARLAAAEPLSTDPASLLSYAEVQDRLLKAVWSEIEAPATATPPAEPSRRRGAAPAAQPAAAAADIDSLRRNLQREHLRRLASGVLRPTSSAAADVRAVHREAALRLEAQLKAALSPPSGRSWSPIARAHLADSLATLSEALRAPLMKQGV